MYRYTWTGCKAVSLAVLLVATALAVYRPALSAAPPRAAETTGVISHMLPIPGGKPTAVAVYQAGNKFYVAESFGGNLLAFDGTTHQIEATIPISGIVLEDNLVVNETYGRVYAGSRIWEGSEFGTSSGLIYVVSAATDTVLTTINPEPLLETTLYVTAQDETRDRIYVGGYGLFYIDVATNSTHPITLPSGTDPPDLFMANEMAVNETTNELYVVQTGYYEHHKLWILDADTWAWSWVDFPSLGAYYPQHVAVSETYNKVFVKLIGVPGQAEPGLFALDRDDGSYAFIGSEDYGRMVVNETSGRLYTGVEVGQDMAIVDVATDALAHLTISPYGGTVAVGVRGSTDHAFLADQQFVALVDGASRTSLKIPVANSPTGGILVQDVAVNQDSGWVYVIPDDDLPLVVAVKDPPAGALRTFVYLPLVLCER
jgi:DNA-binding beta-propeller fold protein YncE